MSDFPVNSKEYWEERFSTDWDSSDGKKQTRYFAQIASILFPEWLTKEMTTSSYTFCDAGCGEGDALDVFAHHFPKSQFYGFDFSEMAINNAKESYPQYTYFVDDLTTLKIASTQHYDVVFSSNTLEHFRNPAHILERLASIADKYLILLIPFQEQVGTPEHEMIFTCENIPLSAADMNLVYAKVSWDPESNIYKDQQILLVYAPKSKNRILAPIGNLKDICKITEEQYLSTVKGYICLSQKYDNAVKYTEVLNQEFYEYKVSSKNTHKQLVDSMSTQQQTIQNLCDEKELITSTITNLEKRTSEVEKQLGVAKKQLEESADKYNSLYAFSCNQGVELERIKQSGSYRLGLKLGVLIGPLYRLAKRVANKSGRLVKTLVDKNYSAFRQELISPFLKIYNKLSSPIFLKKSLNLFASEVVGKRIVIFPPTLDWHMPLFQRPHQLAKAYAKKDNTLAIYITTNIKYDHVTYMEKIDTRLWLVNESFFLVILRKLDSALQTIMSISWTPNKRFLDLLTPDYLIYEYIDELEIFDMYGDEMITDHKMLMQRADVTVCTATKLYDQVKSDAKKLILSTNGGDYELFSRTGSFELNPLIQGADSGYDCILGYYGAIAKWFDYDLVRDVAIQKPNWLWILVGLNYDHTLDKSGILDLPNVKYFPPQKYDTLPSFLKGFDIATIPFVINEITLSTSPVKLFEYMAGNKPILTSKMPECLKYESVHIYTTAEEFIRLAVEYLQMKPDDPYWGKLRKDALANTWDAKVDEILDALYERQ